MASRTATSMPLPAASPPLITAGGWLWVGALGVLFAALHYNFLWRMLRIAFKDPNWQHALIVPLISGYFIFQHRQKLLAIRPSVAPAGLIFLFLGMFSYAWWVYPGRNDMFQGYSMILGLFGLVWFLLGTGMLKYLWFPIAYLVFAVKVSDRIWNRIAWVLQDLAAAVSAGALKVLGLVLDMDVQLMGNRIDIWSGGVQLDPMNVAEACSGLRMLMAFVALGVAMTFLSNRAWWQRIVMVLLTVPVAVLVNVGRVVVIGILYAKVNPRLAGGDFHIFVGMLMLIPAAGLFLLLGWILDNILVADPGGVRHDGSGTAGAVSPDPLDRVDGPAQEPGAVALWVVRGLLVGLVLCGSAGFAYGMTLISYQPERFISWLSRPVALAVLAVAVVVLIVSAWRVRPMLAVPLAPKRTTALGIGIGVLLAGVLGLNGVVLATKTVLFKEEVPLRNYLTKVPFQVGSASSGLGVWRMLGQDRRFPKDQEDALGTTNYISRTYIDTTLPDGAPERVVQLHVAYYTGTIDTVPHVPDRCLLAGGARAVGSGIVPRTIELGGGAFDPPASAGDQWIARSTLDPDGTHIPALSISGNIFTYTLDEMAKPANVLYFFAANGKFLRTPEEVRLLAFNPRDRYAYFCKIEVGVPGVGAPDAAAQRAEAFLSVMLPEVMACLPDWVEVENGQYPPTARGRP